MDAASIGKVTKMLSTALPTQAWCQVLEVFQFKMSSAHTQGLSLKALLSFQKPIHYEKNNGERKSF